MKRIARLLREFPLKYSILLPFVAFASGILISEHIQNTWIVIAILAPTLGIVSLYVPALRFLLFIPLGLLFSSAPMSAPAQNITAFSGVKIDVEGDVYRSPETRERGSRLFVEADYVIEDGEVKPASGKLIISTSRPVRGISYGDRIRAIGVRLKPISNFKNPGGFDVKRFYERQGVYAAGFVDGEDQIISFGRDASYSRVLYSLDRLRLKFGYFVSERFPYPESAVLNAITVGITGGIPRDLRTEFSKAGVAHVLAISGLHVGAVAIVFFFLIKWILKRSEYILLRFRVPRIAAALTILPVFLYAAVAGFSTSAVRAFIMISLFLLSIALGKDENKINTLAAAALIILLWHPWSLFDLSFQLSFSAVLGILLMNMYYPFKFGTLRNNIFSLLKTTSAATFATFPFIIGSFGIFPLVAVPANLIVVPFVELFIVPLGLVSFLTFTISQIAASPVLTFDIFFIRMLIFGIGKLSSVPYSSLAVPTLGITSWMLFAASGAVVLLMKERKWLRLALPILIAAFVLSAAYPVFKSPERRELTAYFLDAGDTKNVALFRLPGGENVLIDGGYSNYDRNGYIERAVVGRFLVHAGVRRIDYLILPSVDKDHISGAKFFFDNFEVGKLLTNGDSLDGSLWETIRETGIAWKNLLNYEDVSFSEYVRLEVLKPTGTFTIKDSSLPYPIFLRLTYGDRSFLLCESLYGREAETALLNSYGSRLKSSVLYISESDAENISAGFIRAVSPEIVITGSNDSKMDERNGEESKTSQSVQLFETATDGAVTLTTNGENMIVDTNNGEKEMYIQ